MSLIERIQQKVSHLPLPAQQEVLALVEQLEASYQTNQKSTLAYPLDVLAEITIDGPTDLAARHDFYAHRKAED